MKEIAPYRFSENFIGDWNLFEKAFSNPETIIFYDIDGILIDSPRVVLKEFSEQYKIPANPVEIDSWNYLQKLARQNGLSEDVTEHANDLWYNAEVLFKCPNYLYMKPVVRETIKRFGPEQNFPLTARKPEFTEVTRYSLNKYYPEIPRNNLLIRKESESNIDPEEYKANELQKASTIAPWVVLVDDAARNVETALAKELRNLLIINIPLGKSRYEFNNNHVITIKRFPERLQAHYPLMDAISRVPMK